MLAHYLPASLFALALVFVRLGTAVMLLPGFGEAYVPPRIRLILALLLTLIVTPMVAPQLPPEPASPALFALLVAGEAVIGLYFGLLARIILSALQVAGMVISLQTSFANVLSMDPTTAQQGALVSAFLATLGVLLVFVTDLHQVMLSAVIDSYRVFTPGQPPPFDDMTKSLTETMVRSFVLATQVAAPFLVIGFVFYVGLGVLGRLMPQVQMFFISMPLQVGMGLVLLMLTIGAISLWFVESMRDVYAPFVGG